MSDNDEAAARRRYCAAALSALDVFEAAVDPRVLVDFQDTRAHPHNRRKEPMGLQRLREKINEQLYTENAGSGADRSCIFSRFDFCTGRSAFVPSNGKAAVQQRMADALFRWLSVQIRMARFAPTVEHETELEHWKTKVKELEDEYIADQEARKAAMARASPGPAAYVAAAAPVLAASMAKQPVAASSSSIPALAAATAAAVSSRSRTSAAGSVALRGAGAEQDERNQKESAVHPLSASAVGTLPTASAQGATATVARPCPPPALPAAASVGASAAATASAAASSPAVPATKPASLAASLRALADHAEQLEQDKAQLQQQLNERSAELASTRQQAADDASQAKQRIGVKEEKLFDAQTDACSASQLAVKATAGKRKAEDELESEAKRHRGELVALAERTNTCIVCFSKQPDVLFQRCGHLVCCHSCSDSIVNGPAAGALCPQCQGPLVAGDRIKVNRT